MNVKFSYKVEGEPSPEDAELMRLIDERMKAVARASRKTLRSPIQADGGSKFGFRYKVTMPDGTVVDQGEIPVDDPVLSEAIRLQVGGG